jgi:hypothetical protein
MKSAISLEEGGYSIFIHFLLEGLKGTPKSVDANGNITPKSLSDYVYMLMPNHMPIRKVKDQVTP